MSSFFKTVAVGLLGCSAGLFATGSCNRQVKLECYQELEYVEPQPGTLPPDFPYCDRTYATVPQPPEEYTFTHRVGVAFVPTDEEPCDPCDVERFEGLLRVAVEERMSQGSPSCARMMPSDPVGLCVHPPNDTTDECTVLGIFYSNYQDVPIEHGCTDCREEGSCPGT